MWTGPDSKSWCGFSRTVNYISAYSRPSHCTESEATHLGQWPNEVWVNSDETKIESFVGLLDTLLHWKYVDMFQLATYRCMAHNMDSKNMSPRQSIMICKAKICFICPIKLLEHIGTNVMQITTNEWLGKTCIIQNVGLTHGKFMSPLLYKPSFRLSLPFKM